MTARLTAGDVDGAEKPFMVRSHNVYCFVSPGEGGDDELQARLERALGTLE